MSDRRAPIELVTVSQLVEMFTSTLGAEKSSEEIAAALSRLGIYGVTLSSDQTTILLDAMSKSPGMVGITARVARSRLELGRTQPPPYTETTRPSESFHGGARAPSEPMAPPRAPRPSSQSSPRNPPSLHTSPAQSSSRPLQAAGHDGRAPGGPPSSQSPRPVVEPFHGAATGGPAPFAFSSEESPTSRVEPSGRTVTPSEVASLLANALSPEGCLEAVRNAIRTLDLRTEHLDKAQAVAVLDLLAKEPGPLGLCARFGKARLILRFAA
jgi:hypothetical protein